MALLHDDRIVRAPARPSGDFAPVRQKPVFTRVGQHDEENVRQKLGAVLPAMELLEPGDAVPERLVDALHSIGKRRCSVGLAGRGEIRRKRPDDA